MLSIAERVLFVTAVRYVAAAELERYELEALRQVTFRPSSELRGLKGCFVGIQATAGERPGTWRRGANGTITAFVRSHPFGDVQALARTLLHEVDHALGLNEAEVQRRDHARQIASVAAIMEHRPRLFGAAPKRRPLRVPVRRPPVLLG